MAGSQASTITLDKASGPVQITDKDGKDHLFLPGRAVEDVPADVVKALDDVKAKYDSGSGSDTGKAA